MLSVNFAKGKKQNISRRSDMGFLFFVKCGHDSCVDKSAIAFLFFCFVLFKD